MRYLALCTDYDGTLAHDGRVDGQTLAALERLLASGRKLVLVTGRELDQLLATFPEVHLFESVVAENGALLYQPSSKKETLLAEPPPAGFVEALRERGVGPISVGRVIIATWEPHETTVLQVIRDLGLELQVIFNKGAVMVLPAGVNKATGLVKALRELGLSPHNAVAVGDAENDHAFLGLCECAVAVANALPTVQDRADFVTRAERGAGVVELIDELLANDLAEREPLLKRHHVLLGTGPDGAEVRLPVSEVNLLIAGTSGSGKSTVTTGLIERMGEAGYQFCVIDPEGDYSTFKEAVVLGTTQHAPGVEEVLQLLKEPKRNVVVNLVSLPFADRPAFLLALLPHVLELRARTGRPHWLVVDETHHMLPASWEPAALALPQALTGLVRITVEPSLIAAPALATVETVLAVGDAPEETIRRFCTVVGQRPPHLEAVRLEPGEVLCWSRSSGGPPFRVHVAPGHTERRRHSRKYAEGELPPDRSFYFTGADGKLNLRAQNLILFAQIAEGVDDGTWMYHLRKGDYSLWFREKIKDDELAQDAEAIQADRKLTPAESRRRVRAAIEARYTLPATGPMPVAGTDAGPRYN